jgi:excisionase family DNA binding protein
MLTVKEIAKVWGVSPCRVRQLLKDNRIAGARKVGRDWLIPKDAKFPAYRREWTRRPTSAGLDGHPVQR